MSRDHQSSVHFRHRRQMLLGSGAALLSFGIRADAQSAAKPLQVGGLPVTCNLTLPVACSASNAGGSQSLHDANYIEGLNEVQRQPQVGETIHDLSTRHLMTSDESPIIFEVHVPPQMTNQLGTLCNGVLSTLITEASGRFL